jgi:hypothetical protein
MADALKRAAPQTVALMCSDQRHDDDVRSVMGQVARMIKASEQRGDSLDDPSVITRMAARINQREASVRAAIKAHHKDEAASMQLQYLLDETRAYRKYVRQAAAEEVLRTTM